MGQISSLFERVWGGSARTDAITAEQYLIFQTSRPPSLRADLPAQYTVRTWKPSLTSIIPPTFGLKMAGFWLFHYARVFRSLEYEVIVIEKAGRIVHTTCVVPKFFRWPFMDEGDVQISSMWTDTEHRGLGLATAACQYVISSKTRRGRVWFASRIANQASLAVCKKCSFQLVGTAIRASRFGSRIFGTLSLLADRPSSTPQLHPAVFESSKI